MQKKPARIIRQSVTLPGRPSRVYDILMSTKHHSAFSGSKASISTIVGGKFTSFDGYATGRNLELVDGKKIVQSWRANDWPRGATSVVTFALAKAPQGTRLTFTQKGIPAAFVDDIKQGWIDYYWKPMREYLGTH